MRRETYQSALQRQRRPPQGDSFPWSTAPLHGREVRAWISGRGACFIVAEDFFEAAGTPRHDWLRWLRTINAAGWATNTLVFNGEPARILHAVRADALRELLQDRAPPGARRRSLFLLLHRAEKEARRHAV